MQDKWEKYFNTLAMFVILSKSKSVKLYFEVLQRSIKKRITKKSACFQRMVSTYRRWSTTVCAMSLTLSLSRLPPSFSIFKYDRNRFVFLSERECSLSLLAAGRPHIHKLTAKPVIIMTSYPVPYPRIIWTLPLMRFLGSPKTFKQMLRWSPTTARPGWVPFKFPKKITRKPGIRLDGARATRFQNIRNVLW